MSGWIAGLHRDVRDVVRELMAQGWEYDRTSGKNHPRLFWPASGERISIPSTPSDYRSLPNVKANAARISGVRGAAHRSPKFTAQRGSGFDLAAAARDSARRKRRIDELTQVIDEITADIAALDIRRDRAQAVRLASKRIALTTELQRLGAEDPPLPYEPEDAA